MVDIKFIRENLDEVKKNLERRGSKVNIDELLKADDDRKNIQYRIETLRAEGNQLAKGKERNDRAIEIKKMIKDLEPQLADAQENYKVLAVQMPNMLLEDVPDKEPEELKTCGEIDESKNLDHVEIGTKLDLIDIERAGKVSGSRFYYLKNEAVDLEFALIKYAMDVAKKEGFQPIIPPILIKEDAAWGTGHFEAINDDAYHMKNDPLVAVGTSEQSILPYYGGEILSELPKKYIGFSTCLRREAGSYGKDVKGIIRAHQFDKLELISFCNPENSEEEHKKIINIEEQIVSNLEIPYRLLVLPANDLGLPSAKTVDLECYFPGQKTYRETHSSSNCTDFQARRLNIKYNDRESGKTEFVHIINGTAIAIGRMLVAIMENNYESGKVLVPEVLQKYCGFKEIGPKE